MSDNPPPAPPKDDDTPAATTPGKESFGTLYIDFAYAAWKAQESIADSLQKRVRLLTTLATTLLGAMLFRLSQGASVLVAPDSLYGRPRVFLLWNVAFLTIVLTGFFLVGRSGAVRRVGVGLFVLGLVLAVLFSAASFFPNDPVLKPFASYIHAALVGIAVSIVVCSLLCLTIAVTLVLSPLRAADAGEETPVPVPGGSGQGDATAEAAEGAPAASPIGRQSQSSGNGGDGSTSPAAIQLKVSQVRLKKIEATLNDHEWSVFKRWYRALLELETQNLRLRDQARASQRLVVVGVILIPIALVMLAVAQASTPGA